MLLDHMIMSFGCFIVCIPILVVNIISLINSTHSPTIFMPTVGFFYSFALGINVYFFKDSINGRSPGKRITKLQVIDNKTNMAASPLKCFIRNIFIIIWPIEGIISIINPSRRIGDFVANTKVVNCRSENNNPKINYVQIIIPFCIMLMILYAMIALGFYPRWMSVGHS